MNDIYFFSCKFKEYYLMRLFLILVFNLVSGWFQNEEQSQQSSENSNCIELLQSMQYEITYQNGKENNVKHFDEQNYYYCIFQIDQNIRQISFAMKKVKSPVKLTNIFLANQKTVKNDQIMSNYKQVPSILKRTHEQQHKRNANSIKKVLKELQQFKKQLKEIKTIKRLQSIPQQLDNSKCRRLNAQTKRSSPSQQFASHSSSKNKTFSGHKETSTQTKRLNRNINQFSFSIHDKSSKSPFDNKYSQQESQDSSQNPFSAKKFMLSDQQSLIKQKSQSRQHLKLSSTKDKIQSIEASQKYEKYLNLLKQSFQTLSISSNAFSTQDKLRINIEIQRMSNQIRRIPIYMRNPDQYYQLAVMYARGLNNQLNNLAIIMNRCDGRIQELREKRSYENIHSVSKEKACPNCEQNEKKDFQRNYKRQLKRLQKQSNRIYKKLEKANQQIGILSNQNLLLIKQKDERKQRDTNLQKKYRQEQGKVKLLKRQIQDLQQVIQDSNSIRLKEVQKNKLQEQDLNYYKSQIQKLKKNSYSFREQRPNRQKSSQDHLLIAELKGKQQLYQSIIKDKECLIDQLKKQISLIQSQFSGIRVNKKKTFKNQRQENSSDSSEYYQLKLEIQEKEKLLAEKDEEIYNLKEKNVYVQKLNKEMVMSLEKCTNQISKLHIQIDALQQANEKFKDKYLKSKVKNENKIKRDIQMKTRKGKAFQQINDLIKHHKNVIQNDLHDQ